MFLYQRTTAQLLTFYAYTQAMTPDELGTLVQRKAWAFADAIAWELEGRGYAYNADTAQWVS